MYAMRVKLLQAPELHAKVYLIDNTALVTSANATWSGLTKNHECGIAVESAQVCDALWLSFNPGLARLMELSGLPWQHLQLTRHLSRRH